MYPYKIYDLGTLPGGSNTIPNAINSKGEIVGITSDSLNDNKAFYWKSTTGLKPLPLLAGGRSSSAEDINDRGEIVGFCSRLNPIPVSYSPVATYWKAGIAYDISLGESSIAHSINNRGEIAGKKYDFNTHQEYACVWKNGVMSLLQLAKYKGSDQYVQCAGISIISNGEIFGHIIKSLFSSIYPYETALKWDTAGNVYELDFPDNQDAADGTRGRDSNVHAANDAGIAVGNIFNYSNLLPFFWNPIGSKGALGLLPGTVNGDANDINLYGQIVGWTESITNMGRQERATIWNGPVITDLNELIDPATGWVLTRANCINSNGQIAGVGLLNGKYRGWTMTPAIRKIKIPAMFWHIVFGVVTDGPGVIIGPGGPRPVPPWNPMIKHIAEPYRSLLKELLLNQTVSTTKKLRRK
jgi:uncharacterized membrane protein